MRHGAEWGIAAALVLAGCSSPLACGEGTIQMGDQCVPTVACGRGTTVMNDVCVPESMLVCGTGTIRSGDACVRDELDCPTGTIQRGDVCVTTDAVSVRIPLEPGRAAEVGQGMHGYFSHHGRQVHAIDFAAEIGTTIVAARDGIAVDVREDSSSGCGDESCANQGNYVRVDHGDGTYALYLHLDTNGALVDIGDRVCAGEPIALSGNTGWSTAPHLHFQVEDAFGYSLPLHFEELAETGGWLFAGATVTSTNEAPASCDHSIAASDCPPDLFAHDGIADLAGMPCALADRGTTYRVTGRVLGDTRTAQLGVRGDLDADWSYECARPGDGTFAIDLTFPLTRVRLRAYASVTGVSATDCADLDGSDAAPRIVVR